MASNKTIIPIYTTSGEVGAYLVYPYLYNRLGEWIGWITPERIVFSVHGHYVGWLTNDPRILRKRAEGFVESRRQPPERPSRLLVPAHVALAPMMPELTIGVFDVLEEDPDLLPTLDYGDLREDMD